MKIPLVIFLFVLTVFPNAAWAESASDYAFNTKNLPSGWEIENTNEQNYSDTYAEEKECGIKYCCYQSLRVKKNDKKEWINVKVSVFETAEGARRILTGENMPRWQAMAPYGKPRVEVDEADGIIYRSGGNPGESHVYFEAIKGNVYFATGAYSYNEKLAHKAMLILLGEISPVAIPKPVVAGGVALAALAGLGLLAKALAGAAAKAAAASAAKGAASAAKSIRISMRPQVPSVQIGPKIKFTEPKETAKTEPREEKKEKEKKEEEKKEEEKKKVVAEIQLLALPDEVVADGKSKSKIVVKAFDQEDAPFIGAAIELWFEKYDGSKIEPQLVVTGVGGMAEATFTASDLSGEQEVSVRAQSNWDVKAKVKIKLKEEVYYEVKDKEGLFRLRVNIPSKNFTTIRKGDVCGARVLDRFDKEIKIGFSSTLLDLAALVGYYGIKSDAVYKAAHEKWQDVHRMCHKIAGDLDAGIKIGFTAGAINVINSLAISIAEAFGEKPVSLASKVLGKANSALDKSILSVETQDEVRFQIVEEKKCYERMASCAEELANCWGQVNSSGGDPMSAGTLIRFKRELEFYELNDKILEIASQKGEITKTFSDSDFAAIKKDRENIKNTIHIATSQMSDIYELKLKIRDSLYK